MWKSLRAFVSGTVGWLVTALGSLATLIAVARYVDRSHSWWMWLFFGSLAFVVLAFVRFHQMRVALAEDEQYALDLQSIDWLILYDDHVTPHVVNGVQLRLIFLNSSSRVISYEVESISVVVNGKTVNSPVFLNRGGLIRPTKTDMFRFPQITGVTSDDLQRDAEIDYVVVFGRPAGPKFRKTHSLVANAVRAPGSDDLPRHEWLTRSVSEEPA